MMGWPHCFGACDDTLWQEYVGQQYRLPQSRTQKYNRKRKGVESHCSLKGEFSVA